MKIFAIATLIVLLPLSAAGQERNPGAPARIEVAEVHGSLVYGGKPLAKGDVVDGAEPVTLAEGGTALLSLPQGLIRLTGPASFTADRDSFSLSKGYALAVLRKLKRRWSFRTPSVVAAVRGTTFYVEAGEKSTYLCLCEGTLMLDSPEGSKDGPQKISTKEHQAFAFEPGGKRLKREPKPMRDHSDDEIATMKKRL